MPDLRPVLRRWELAFFRSRLAGFFDWLMTNKARHLYALAADDVGPLPAGSRLADIGCGMGNFLLTYLSRHPQVHGFGLDQSPALIRLAQKKSAAANVPAEFHVGDVHTAPLPAAAFDTVFSGSSIYCWHDPVTALDRLYDALKPGGALLIYDELPVRSLRQAIVALFQQRLYGLGLPAYSEAELREFIARSRFRTADVRVDQLVIRLHAVRPPVERP
jgi:ubiquinone/menaquinone biosynthesis C-methylase UbiE